LNNGGAKRSLMQNENLEDQRIYILSSATRIWPRMIEFMIW
jgi:hypothetical protein